MTGHLLTSAHLLVSLALSTLLGNSCSDRSFYFSYDHHGEDWQQGECASRDRQSPIDFGREAPWSCNPPVLDFLRQRLGPKYFKKLGFAKLAGDSGADDEDSDGDAVGAPGPAGAMAFGPAPAASLLQLGEGISQPMAAPAPAMVMSPPTPPPMIVPGCGPQPLGAFFFKYDRAEKPLTIQNNGHTISTDLKGHGLGSITWDGYIFDVLSVNFHVHSEHTFNGEEMPLELHIVHREPETDHVLVVAVPFQEFPSGASFLQRNGRGRRGSLRGLLGTPFDVKNAGNIADITDMSEEEEDLIMPSTRSGAKEPKPSDPGFSEILANLMTYPLPQDGEEKSVPLRAGPVDLLTELIGGPTKMPQGYFQYRGSLTAPPCSEQVTWLVRKEPLQASRTQIEVLRIAIMQANSNFNNARSVMPLMGRHILYRLAVEGDPPPPPNRPVEPGEEPLERNVEFRGVSAAKEAVTKAMEAARAQGVITDAVAAAQRVSAGAAAAVDPSVVADPLASGDIMITTPLPTPNPERVLSRIVDAVAVQMEGAEKAAVMAAAGVVASR